MIKSFDKVTQFRLINAFIINFLVESFAPLLRDMQGELWTPSVISIFMILSVLAVKGQKLFINKSLDYIYKAGIYNHLLLNMSLLLFFYNKNIFIITESLVGMLSIMIFGAFSIKLDSYLTKYHHEDFERFKIYRNSMLSNFILGGLLFSTILLYFLNSNDFMIILITLHFIFAGWLISNFNYFKEKKL